MSENRKSIGDIRKIDVCLQKFEMVLHCLENLKKDSTADIGNVNGCIDIATHLIEKI